MSHSLFKHFWRSFSSPLSSPFFLCPSFCCDFLLDFTHTDSGCLLWLLSEAMCVCSAFRALHSCRVFVGQNADNALFSLWWYRWEKDSVRLWRAEDLHPVQRVFTARGCWLVWRSCCRGGKGEKHLTAVACESLVLHVLKVYVRSPCVKAEICFSKGTKGTQETGADVHGFKISNIQLYVTCRFSPI